MPGPFAPDRLYSGALAILRTLHTAGHEAYIAGGAVRDYLLGREQHDLDIATSARPDQIRPLFPRTFAIGESFGVILVRMKGRDYELATFREEQDYRDGRRPDSVQFSTARADVERRDFTINGMLWDARTESVIDWVGGREDIRRRCIRTIGKAEERFAEDRLRMLRALRFAAQLDFRIDEATWRAICHLAEKLDEVSSERMREELQKILCSPRSARGLRQLAESGIETALTMRYLKNLNDLQKTGSRRPSFASGLGDLFPREGVAEPLDGWFLLNFSLLGGMLHKTGGTSRNISWQNHLRGLAKKLFCKEMYLLAHGQKHSNEECRSLQETAELCFALAGFHQARLADQLRLLRSPEFPRLRRLVPILFRSEAEGLEKTFSALEGEHGERLHPEPLLNGHDLLDLGVPRGPRLKQLLHDLESEQLEGRLGSAREARRYLRERLQG